MKNLTKILVLLAISVLLLSSCRSRKIDISQKENNSEKISKIDSSAKSSERTEITNKDSLKVILQDNSKEYSSSFDPIDSARPVIVDSRVNGLTKYYNARNIRQDVKNKKIKQETTGKNELSSKTTKQSEGFKKEIKSENIKNKEKLVKKDIKSSIILNLFPYFSILLILLILFLIYKFRKKIPYIGNFF